MKPVFYKKLVPLAMIASMAMSNLSVVADAIDAQPVAPEVTVAEETTVDEIDQIDEIIDEEDIEVPDVVLPDVQDYAAAGEATITAKTTEIEGIFLTSDSDATTRTFDLDFELSVDGTNFKEIKLAGDTKGGNLPAGVTIKTSPASEKDVANGTTVKYTVEIAKSAKSGVKLYLVGTTNAVDADEDADTSAIASKTVASGAVTYKKIVNKVTTEIADAEEDSEIVYDVFDDDNAVRTVDVTFDVTKDASATINNKKLTVYKVGDNGNEELDTAIKVAYKFDKTASTLTATLSIPKGISPSSATAESYVLEYAESDSNKATANFKIKAGTAKALGKDAKGTVYDSTKAELTGYYGTSSTIDLTQLTGGAFTIKAGAFKDNKTIKFITNTNNSSKISLESKAFENCPNLVLIDLNGSNAEATVAADAIVNCEKTFIKTKQEGSEWIKTLKATGRPVIAAKTTPNSDGTQIVNAGDELKANLVENILIYNDTMYKMTGDITDADKQASEAQLANAKWVFQDINKSTAEKKVTSSAAKFSNGTVNKKSGLLTYNTASNKGEVALVGNMKSAGAFNSAVRLVAQIPTFDEKGKITGYTDYASFDFYVNPSKVTEFKDVKPVAGKFETSEENSIDYVLTVAENASYKIPVAAKDGQNKALYYEAAYTDNGSFTVVNGVVKGLKATTDAGIITVKAQDGADDLKDIKVKVVVTSATKGLKANVGSLSIAPNLTQSFTVAPTSDSGEIEATVAYDKATYVLKQDGTAIAEDGKVKINSASEFTIEFAEGKAPTDKKAFTAAMKSVTFTYAKAKGNGTLKVGLNYATAPTDAKSIKQAAKKTASGVVNVAVPVGGIYNLGVSVAPTTAQNALTWQVKDATSGTWNNYVVGANDAVEIKGGVIVGKTAGTMTVRAVATTNSDLVSYEYNITTYVPASSIEWDSTETSYGLRGGFLIGSDINTNCTKELSTGSAITFKAPVVTGGAVAQTQATATGAEKIIWTANKPGSVFIDDTNGTMTIKPLAKGTYTITGVTEYTKQKISFKVNAQENDTADSAKLMYKAANTADAWEEATTTAITASVGDKIQFAIDNNATKTAPTFATSDAKIAAVNKATGLVTIKKAGEVKISAAGKEVTINVPASATDAKLKVATFVKEGGVFSASTALTNAKWYYVKDNGTDVKELKAATGKNKYEAPADGEGKYTLYAWTKTEAPNSTTIIDAPSAELNVFGVVATKATVLDPWKFKFTGEQSFSEVKNYGSLKDLANAKFGIVQGAQFILPVNATGLDADKKTVAATSGDIDWVSSNSNIAKVIGKSDSVPEGAYAGYIVETSSKYTGKVTLTGTLKNSGKKVKVTLNVNAAAEAPASPTT